jgi:hypothetical protein
MGGWTTMRWTRLVQRGLVGTVLCVVVVPGCSWWRGNRTTMRDREAQSPSDDCPCHTPRRRMLPICKSVHPSEPYREFDDHFPHFHPVPAWPVFPSLEECGAACSESPVPGHPRPEQPRLNAPNKVDIPTAPLPEVLPPTPGLPGPRSLPINPGPATAPKTTTKPLPGASWVFRPAATPPSDRPSRSPASGQDLTAGQDISEAPRVLR